MRKKAAGILKAVWTIVISVALVSAAQAAWERSRMKEPFYYTEGAEIEMFIDGKWTRGKVVNGYRFRDGLITMETAEGRRVWCGEASGAWREPERSSS